MQQDTKNSRLQQVADLLLEKVGCRLEDTQWADLTPQAAKHISAILKDIAQLQTDAQPAQTVTVQLAPELEGLGR